MVKNLDIAKNVTPIAETAHVSKTIKEAAKEKMKELIADETRLVKGLFQCFDAPGSAQTISVKKYPGVEPFRMTMLDGCMYEIPLYVARFLNGVDISAGALGDPNKKDPNIGTCSYAVSGFKWDKGQEAPRGVEGYVDRVGPSVVPMVGIAKRVRRYGFQSTEFGAA